MDKHDCYTRLNMTVTQGRCINITPSVRNVARVISRSTSGGDLSGCCSVSISGGVKWFKGCSVSTSGYSVSTSGSDLSGSYDSNSPRLMNLIHLQPVLVLQL